MWSFSDSANFFQCRFFPASSLVSLFPETPVSVENWSRRCLRGLLSTDGSTDVASERLGAGETELLEEGDLGDLLLISVRRATLKVSDGIYLLMLMLNCTQRML